MKPRPRFPARLSALLVVTALAATACHGSGSRSAGSSAASDTPSPTGASSSTVAGSTGNDITSPGTKLSFGDTARVAYQVGKDGTVLDLTVKSATQGTLADFQGFDMSDPYKRKGSYYYVRVTVKNAGKQKFGGVPVPLWGISDKGTLLQAVDFTSAFAKCPTESLPKDFAPHHSFETCLVYLSPNHGGLTGVSYRPTVAYQPIEWHGKVRQPTKAAKSKKPKQ